jgi:hypothetical protein
MYGEGVRTVSETFRAIALQAGEPLISVLSPDQFAAMLADSGFAVLEDVGAEDVEGRYGLPAMSLGNERIALADAV